LSMCRESGKQGAVGIISCKLQKYRIFVCVLLARSSIFTEKPAYEDTQTHCSRRDRYSFCKLQSIAADGAACGLRAFGWRGDEHFRYDGIKVLCSRTGE